jgi:hypothetical protein
VLSCVERSDEAMSPSDVAEDQSLSLPSQLDNNHIFCLPSVAAMVGNPRSQMTAGIYSWIDTGEFCCCMVAPALP